MGKNQQHKSRQQARLHQSSSAQGEGEPASGADGVDASFHSAEWHAARVAALQVERPSWESWRLKQKEDEEKERAVLDEQERAMREYKALLEADRAKRLDSAGIADRKEEDSDRRRRKKKVCAFTFG